MSLEISILVFTCLANLSLGLFILLRNPRILSSIAFFVLTVCVSGWAVSNYLTESLAVPLNINSLFNRLAYFFGLLCLVSVAVFCYSFPFKVRVPKWKAVTFWSLVGIMSILSLTELVAGEVSYNSGGLHFTVGPLSVLYSIALLSLLIVGIRHLMQTRKRSKPQVRSQISLVLTGFTVSACLALLMNVILPTISSSYQTAKFGPLLTVFFVATTTYAIIKHRLFDVRLIVARSMAYIFFIATLAALFFAVVYLLTISNIASHDIFAKQLAALFAALLLVSTAPLVRKFIDKLTNKLFYRDAYDPQLFLDKLNNTIISNIEFTILLRQAAMVIEANLKCERALFSVFGDDNVVRFVSSTGPSAGIEDMKAIRDELKTKLVHADELESDEHELRSLLQRNKIAVIASLHELRSDAKVRSYLLLGHKKSGSAYTAQDLRMISIIANELSIAIQNALRFEEIQNFNITLQQKINAATHKLQQANKKLKDLDATKDDFISMASHQLRTPLTSVKGYLSMVIEGDAGKVSPKQKEMLEQALFSSQRMVYLIADLLNVSRLKTGKFVIEPQLVNLDDIVAQEIDQLEETAKSRSLTLTYAKQKNFPELMLDETKTRQVIMNFIDNAIYYTPAGGKIKVELNENDASVELKVIDNGLGVPKSEQPHLFTKFYRAGNARKARPDGTGLGLFMAKKIIIAQGGSLVFESQEGKGSTFGFIFSKSKNALPQKAS